MTRAKIILLVAFILACAVALPCAAKPISEIEIISGGAKYFGLGRAGLTIVNDANSIFINPAGLGMADSWGITSMSTRLLGKVNVIVLGGSYPTQWGTIGIGLINATSPAGYYTTDEDSLDAAPAIGYSDSVLYLSYGQEINHLLKNIPKRMGKMSIGANFKIYQKGFSGTGVNNYNGLGFDVDAGIIFQPNPYFALGLNISNMLPSSFAGSIKWKSKETEYIPTTLKAGMAVKPLNGFTLLLDFYYTDKLHEPLTLHCGGEYTYMEIISLRAGLNQRAASEGTNTITTENNFTAGLGLSYQGFSFDYAYCPNLTLSENTAHYFSIGYIFTPISEPKKKDAADAGEDIELLKDLEKFENLDSPPTKAPNR